jgi:hypothetical protein
VGVVGESIADLTEWVKPERKKKRLEKASALVLILGLAGDLVAIHISQVELARVTTDVGNTRRAAEKAAQAAARADTSAQQASKEAGDAVQAARKAEAVAAKAEAEAIRAESDEAELRKATAPRRVSSGQRKMFLANFRLSPSYHPALEIWYDALAPDAHDFAQDLSDLFRATGFRVDFDEGPRLSSAE